MSVEGGDRLQVVCVLRRYFERRGDVSMAFLFGSVSKGKATGRSDVDVAVYLREPYESEKVRDIGGDLEATLGRDVDVVALNGASPSVAWDAVRGVPLLIDDYAFYLNYMLDVSRESEDFTDLLLDLWSLRRQRRGGPAKVPDRGESEWKGQPGRR